MVPRYRMSRALSTASAKLMTPYDVLSPLPSPQADTAGQVLFSEVIRVVNRTEINGSIYLQPPMEISIWRHVGRGDCVTGDRTPVRV